jgi:pSer/pThr/pTyr-binding forkhead associated (FHA) protein
MSARVILTATHGALKGQEYTFTGKARCVLGRSQACDVQVPAADFTVSRRHCLLDVDAPTVTVQDLGSLNGTFVNEELIGRRDKRIDAAEACAITQPRYSLGDGDELRVGDLVFRVDIVSEPAAANSENGVNCLICI